MAVDNATILDRVRLYGTNDYQLRIPEASQGNIKNTVNTLFEPMNRKYFNDFIWSLVNRIGLTVMAQNEEFRNPLDIFKKENLYWGSTVQENAVKWIQAHGYKDDVEELLKLHRPEGTSWFHTENRKDNYPISVIYDELRKAFNEEYGLNRYVAQLMNVPRNSDNYDEMNIMLQLMGFYERVLGFYKVHLDSLPQDRDSATILLKALRTEAGNMRFPSTTYNALNVSDIPAFTQPNRMVLFATPAVMASLDVDALSAVFQIDRADIPYRIIEVPQIPIAGAVALLVSLDWYQVRDTNYTITQFQNAQTLAETYWLHHWGIYSVSPFTPCVLFTTQAGSNIPLVTQTVVAWSFEGYNMDGDKVSIVDPGDVVELKGQLAGEIVPTGTRITLQPQSATYEVSLDSNSSSQDLSINTFVDNRSRLHIQRDGLHEGDIIQVVGTSTYLNPNGETEVFTEKVSLSIGHDSPEPEPDETRSTTTSASVKVATTDAPVKAATTDAPVKSATIDASVKVAQTKTVKDAK